MKPFIQGMETKMVKGGWSVIVDQNYFANKNDKHVPGSVNL